MTTSPTSSLPPEPPPPDEPDPTLATTDVVLASGGSALVADTMGDYLRAIGKRIRSGESGILPVLLGLIILVIVFQSKNSNFLTPLNITNLFRQGSTFVLLGVAEVFVLLLGEIDLSIGFVAALGAVASVSAFTVHGWPSWAAIVLGLAITSALGALNGVLITMLKVPSFIVTLGGLLGYQGVLLYFANREGGTTGGGTIGLSSDSFIFKLVNGNISPTVGWVAMVVIVVVVAAMMLYRDAGRRRAGLVTAPLGVTIAKIVLMAVAGIVLLLICNHNRGSAFATIKGVPWSVPIVLAIVAAWSFLLDRTKFGRYMYAIGGNAEAARRSGIGLTRMRILAFTLTGLTAGAGGLMYASQLGSISNNVNGGQLVLFAVAAAVIGGTSLFGGRGKIVHALLGGLVIATIYNGLFLLSLNADVQDIVTALVLLAAATVDAVARRGQAKA